jgi:hypothetical protein
LQLIDTPARLDASSKIALSGVRARESALKDQ